MAELPKVDLESKDLVAERIEQMKALFPEIVTEGNGTIDFEKLRLILGDEIVEGDERYAFTWPGKADAIRQSQTVSTSTLRPVQSDSVDWDTTQNLYIEGDNLEVLKLLQRAYHGKIKVIYIDPPYNTGNDFVYKDSFGDSVENYREQAGLSGQSNADTSGRFHSNWCTMMYPRLRLARELLSEDGVIFISIDDNEDPNLIKLCEEVFGENNFITQLVWEKKKKGAFLSKHFISMKEYVLVFCKDVTSFAGLIGEINHSPETYPCIKLTNARGTRVIRKGTPCKARERDFVIRPNTRYSSGNMELIYLDEAVIEDGVLQNDVTIDSNWIYGQDKLDGFSENGEVYITQDLYIRRIVTSDRVKMLKDLLTRVGADGQSLMRYQHDDNLNNGGWGTNEDANDELHQILDVQNAFDFSKPTRLIGKLIQSVNDPDAIVMDFFAGSSTTADALFQVNAADGGSRRFICVQLPETTKPDSVAALAGFENVCELGKERMRRAGRKTEASVEEANRQLQLGESPKSVPDIGFRVLKLDESGIQRPQEGQLIIDRIKPDRTDLDIIFEMMLKWGLELTYPVDEDEIEGYPVYSIAYDELICCMQPGLTVDVLEAIAARKPRRVFLLDSVIDDTVKLNALQIFKRVEERTQQKIDLRTV